MDEHEEFANQISELRVHARAAVEEGAALLDLYNAPTWPSHINLDSLDMASCSCCILGQVAGSYDAGVEALTWAMGSGILEPDQPQAIHAEAVRFSRYGFLLPFEDYDDDDGPRNEYDRLSETIYEKYGCDDQYWVLADEWRQLIRARVARLEARSGT